jgi:1-deoxy-D-xylulose-5-phosphate reductoisomerase
VTGRPQRLVVLGATGTVGRNTLDVARRHRARLEVLALSAERNAEGLAELCRDCAPRYAVMGTEAGAARLRELLAPLGLPTEVRHGAEALAQIAAHPDADQVMAAIVGAAGLLPVLAAIDAGKRVLIANKEPLVMAGRLLMQRAQAAGATLIPIDSEHNAIFQCLSAGRGSIRGGQGVRRIILTASGGPFRDTPLTDLPHVTPAQAVRHPNWVMGPKISVDCATMMNKGLELIEAHHLFGLPDERIDVVLHPESVIHSMVEFTDGSTLAQLGQPDMRVPIAHALAWPERWESGVEGLDFAAIAKLQFAPLEPARYPCLALARAALRAGGVAANVLNAANEVAVQAFLDGALPFTRIAPLIEDTLAAAVGAGLPAGESLDDILAVEQWARARAASALPRAAAGAGRG